MHAAEQCGGKKDITAERENECKGGAKRKYFKRGKALENVGKCYKITNISTSKGHW